MTRTLTTHASGGDTLVRVRRRACPRAGGSPTSCCIPTPIIHSPAGGVFAPTQQLIGAGRATPGRTPLIVGSTPSRSTAGAAKPSRRPGPRGDCYGCVYPLKRTPPTATGHIKSGFDSPRGYPVSSTITARPRPRQGRGPTSYRSARVPARTVVERGPVRAAALDDNAHDEPQH